MIFTTINTSIKYWIFLLLLLSVSINGYAKQNELTTNDVENIKAAIEAVLNDHVVLMMLVSKPGNRPEVIADNIANNAPDYYYDLSTSNIETDQSAETYQSGSEEMPIADYLSQLTDYFKPFDGYPTIEITPDWDHKIFQSTKDNNLLITFLDFKQLLKGKDKNNHKFKMVNKFARLVITKNIQWSAKIEGIYFLGKNRDLSNYREVSINNGKQTELIPTVQLDESYYKSRLQQGVTYIDRSEYGKAIYCLKEAQKYKGNSDISDAAEKKYSELKLKLRDKNGIWQDIFYEKLKQEGKKQEDLKNYEIAATCYSLAFEINPAAEVSEKFKDMTNRADKIAGLERLYENGQYVNAKEGYKTELDRDRNNSTLLAGLARCYGRMSGQDSNALEYFKKAIDANPNNVKIYKWQAEYYKNKEQHNEKYLDVANAYINYINHAEPNAPELDKINSYRATYQAIDLYLIQRKKMLAIDSFNKAIQYFPDNGEPYVWLSRYYLETERNYDKAVQNAEFAKNVDPKFAPAYTQLADIQLKRFSFSGELKANEKDKEIAMSLYSSAIEKNKLYADAYEKRGKLRLDILESKLEKNKMEPIADDARMAREDFTQLLENCISTRGARTRCLRYRSICNIYLSEFGKALTDMQTLDNPGITNGNEYFIDYGFLLLRHFNSNKENIEKAEQLFTNAIGKRVDAKYEHRAEYGRYLARIFRNPNSLNENKDEIKKIFKFIDEKDESIVKKDFELLGISALYNQVMK